MEEDLRPTYKFYHLTNPFNNLYTNNFYEIQKKLFKKFPKNESDQKAI